MQPFKDQGDYTIIVKAHPDPNGKNTKEQLMAMVDKYKNDKKAPMQIKFFKSKKQAMEYKPQQEMKKQINEIRRMQQLAGLIKENEMMGDDELQDAFDAAPKVLPWNAIEKAYQESGLTGEEFFADHEDEFRSQFEGKPVSKEAYFKFYADRATGGQDDRYTMVNWIGFTNDALAQKLYNQI